MLKRHLRPLAVAALLLCSTAARAQISPAHVTNCGPATFPGTVCSIPASGTGNLLVVGWQMGEGVSTSTAIATIVDNAGNTYFQAGGARAIDAAAGSMVDVWYAKNSLPGAKSITIVPTSTIANAAAVIWEFSGADTVSPLDRAVPLNSQGSSAIVSGASTTTSGALELVISMAAVSGNVAGLVSGSAFTTDSTLKGNGWTHLLASSPGTYSAQWNQSPAGTYASSTVSFKPAGSPQAALSGAVSACDLNQDSALNVLDVQLAINMSLGLKGCTANIEGVGVCNADVVVRVVNASLGGPCVTGIGAGSSHSVTLNWTASYSPNIAGYNIYRASVSGGPYTRLNTSLVNGTSFADTAVQSGQSYYYVATAVDTSGTESSYSNETPANLPTS